jgi:hypothetical protein
MTQEIGGENGVTPGGEIDADFLEEPAGVGAITVSHVNGGFDISVEWEKGLCEDFTVRSFEV